MAFNPTQEQIDNFRILVPDLDEQQVIRRLKVSSGQYLKLFVADYFQGNNNNVEQAVGEYFDNPSDSNKVEIKMGI